MSEIGVRLAWSGPAGQGEISLQLPAPATLQMAIEHAGERSPACKAAIESSVAFGVWGKARSPDHLLRDGDRVELYRALQADPKEARRSNAQRAPRKTKKM